MMNWDEHAHIYQQKGAAHLWNSTAYDGAAVLWLDPGYGKTMIVLHAFKAMYDAGLVTHCLIVAPLRVVQAVWSQEIDAWSSLNGLRAARLHGPKKETWLKRKDVNIWLINYEGLPWLNALAKKGQIPFIFDVIVFDEIRRMKNAQGKRFKATRPLAAMAKYRWGLTGTPVSNGLMDLFGQFLILDQGASLGNRITKFRHEFFEKHFNGFTWIPRPGAQEVIEKRIERYVFRADGFLDLPAFVYDNRRIVLNAEARKSYNSMKKDLVTSLEGTTVTAANAAVLYGKLKQMANGRIYDQDRNVIKIHDAKIDALKELLEELGDEQLLIAYEYNHDLAQIRSVLGEDVPYIGSGVNEKQMLQTENDWNERKIKVLPVHPASAGHGLNLQRGAAHHILWWGPTINLDFYIQLNDRLRRQGNAAASVIVHTFITEKSVDESTVVGREEKGTLQDGLLSALTAELGDAISIAQDGITTNSEEITMGNLNFKSDAAQTPDAAQPANPFAAPVAGQPVAQPAMTTPLQPALVTDPAPANPFAQGQPAPPIQVQQPAPQPAMTTPAAAAQQAQVITQEVAAQPPAQPAPAEQPVVANPFAGGQTAPVADAEVIEQTAPVGNADTGWQNPTEQPVVSEVKPVSGGYVPLSLMVPASKIDKVMSAIGRALK